MNPYVHLAIAKRIDALDNAKRMKERLRLEEALIAHQRWLDRAVDERCGPVITTLQKEMDRLRGRISHHLNAEREANILRNVLDTGVTD